MMIAKERNEHGGGYRYLIVGSIISVMGLTACDQQEKLTGDGMNTTEDRAEVASNGSYVSLAGTVVEASAEQFQLDYGNGTMTVEMDDWDWYPEGHHLLENDQVVVYGYVDDDFYERRSIEASSVYVTDAGTQFYANGVDEEDFPVFAAVEFGEPQIELKGTVTKVEGDEFHLNTGKQVVEVDTEDMPYDPLDKEGFQQIKMNDRVSVTGLLEADVFDNLEIAASRVVTLRSSKPEASKESG